MLYGNGWWSPMEIYSMSISIKTCDSNNKYELELLKTFFFLHLKIEKFLSYKYASSQYLVWVICRCLSQLWFIFINENKIKRIMDDIYTFGLNQYIPATPIERSFQRTLKNVFVVFLTSVKCAFFGIFIFLKSFLLLFVPMPMKDIQGQVALVKKKIQQTIEILSTKV